MNLVVGNITFDGNNTIPESFDFDVIESINKNGDKNIFLFGETELNTSNDFLDYTKKTIGDIKFNDLSISSEVKVDLMPYDYVEEIYELASFEGEDIEFTEIKERFKDHDAIFSVREAGISEKFGNPIIIVDFIY